MYESRAAGQALLLEWKISPGQVSLHTGTDALLDLTGVGKGTKTEATIQSKTPGWKRRR